MFTEEERKFLLKTAKDLRQLSINMEAISCFPEDYKGVTISIMEEMRMTFRNYEDDLRKLQYSKEPI